MRSKSNALRLCTVLVVLTAIIGQRAAACECIIPDICRLVESHGVIFLGEVVRGGLDPGEDDWSGRPRSATLRVLEVFRGIPQGTQEVTIRLNYRKGMCSPAVYRRGEQTLVILLRANNGLLEDGACGASRLVKSSAEDFGYVRNYFRGLTETVIRGKVAANVSASLARFSLMDGYAKPIEGARVIAENAAGRHTATSNREGEYEFVGIPAGLYRIHAEKQGFSNTDRKFQEPGEYKVGVSSRGCALAYFGLFMKNVVEGSVRDLAGDPVRNAFVSLRGVGNENKYESVTNLRGSYRFETIEPGSYHVVVNLLGPTPMSPITTRFLGNSEDRILNVGPESRLRSVNFRVGPPTSVQK